MFTAGLLPAGIASYLAIITERPNRRGLLALYMFNNVIQILSKLSQQKTKCSLSHFVDCLLGHRSNF